jgi:drug/metabolite transporter (DMT)-like permease
MNEKSKQIAANILMVFGSIIWGGAFVAQSIGADNLGAFTFGAIRFFIGGIIIIPVAVIMSKRKDKKADTATTKDYLIAGVACGAALFLGAYFQQLGLGYTTAGKAGFVTALYIILVPIFGFVLFKRRLSSRVMVATLAALVGIFLLCVSGGFGINIGDLYVFIGSLFWAAQILLIDKFAQKLDGIKFAICEFLSCAAMGAVAMFIFEKPTWAAIQSAWLPLLYCSVLSVGVGFTAQIICQKYTEPTVASLLMSSESVFSVIFGFLILHEALTVRQIVGCVLVFAAVLLAQITPGQKKLIQKEEAK